MTRIDIPTLKCDRCGFTTQDKKIMISFHKLRENAVYNPEWDLCRYCWIDFKEKFMTEKVLYNADHSSNSRVQ